MKISIWIYLTVLLVLSANIITAKGSPSYYCYKTTDPIVIDGAIDEKAWIDIPWIDFLGLVDGSKAPYPSQAKIVWDAKYLYFAFNVEDANVWALVGQEVGEPRKWGDPKRFIMRRDGFVKIFLDPDSDGKNYIEIHINAFNNSNDVWLEHGSTRTDYQDVDTSPANYHLEWDCPGLRSAVKIDGTLNDFNDIDKGWTLEVAIPWNSLIPFSAGRCPPEPGDVWRSHLGRAYKSKIGADRSYYAWPVIGIKDCHQLDRYGYLIFSENAAVMELKKPASATEKNPLEWKMVWCWTLKDKPDAEVVSLAKSLGFNAIQCSRGRNMVRECHKVGMKAIGVVGLGGSSAQRILPEEEKRLQLEKEKATTPNSELLQGGGEPILGGEVCLFDYRCPDRPETLEYAKKCVDKLIADGYDGFALDGLGYKNFYACFCDVSRAEHKNFMKHHPELPPEQAIFRYSSEHLISFCNMLIRYAKEKKPDICTTCHIWPDFAPDPLYGNKAAFDYCGQTVSWFFVPHWKMDKVKRYTYEVVYNESRFHVHSRGAPFIGIFGPPEHDRHKKEPERLRQVIGIIKDSGAKAIQFAELGHILNNPEIAEVVREELTSSLD